MIIIVFLLLALLTIYLSIKLSFYADVISKSFKINTALIGGILLAGLTSLPEFVTCISSIYLNNPYLAIGDILGSNVFNIAIVSVLDIIFIKRFIFNNTSKKHYLVYVLLIINYIFIYLYLNGNLSFSILNLGIPTFVIIITYIYYFFSISQRKEQKDERNNLQVNHPILKFVVVAIFMVLSSIGLTFIVNVIAKSNPTFSSSLLGALLLGITTSLPEVIAFITLIKLNSYDIAVSNIIGSNLFNLVVLAVGDFFTKVNNIYFYSDMESIFLIKLAIITTLLSLFQNQRKKVKRKILYIIPSVIIIILYFIFLFLKL